MPRTMRSERSCYEPVRKFLESEMECVTQSVRRDGSIRRFVGRGLRGLIVDVFGVRGPKGNYSRTLEGIAVEVKRSRTRTSLRSLVQASQYGRLAHRCYLAQPRRFDSKTIDEASRHGIGLLGIRPGRIKVRTESKSFTPDPETFDVFLCRSLDVVRRSLCGCHVCRYRRDEPHINAGGHWVRDEFSPNPYEGPDNKKMYLCARCEAILTGVAAVNSLRRSVIRLERRVRRLRAKRKAKK
jgi:hypothetical protein